VASESTPSARVLRFAIASDQLLVAPRALLAIATVYMHLILVDAAVCARVIIRSPIVGLRTKPHAVIELAAD